MTLYMAAGCPFEVCRKFGRWRSESAAREYFEILDDAIADFVGPVVRGYRDPRVHPVAQVPVRHGMLQRAWAAARRNAAARAASAR